MKLADLIPGQEYLVNRDTDWDHSQRRCKRVRVLTDRKLVVADKYGYRRDASPLKVLDHRGVEWLVQNVREAHSYDRVDSVLCVALDPETGIVKGRPFMVAGRAIRGPWESTYAAVMDKMKAREEAAAETRRQQADALRRQREVLEALAAVGVQARAGQAYSVLLTTPEAERLAERLAQ